MSSLILAIVAIVIIVLIVLALLKPAKMLMYWFSILILPLFGFMLIQAEGYEKMGFLLFLISGLCWAHLIKRIQKHKESQNGKE
jgi:membrane protein implicated in regulation of membrane protease activity